MVDHLFRQESGKMIAMLCQRLGIRHLQLVEDAVQDAFVAAHQQWAISEPPANPAAWLMRTACNRAIDLLRRQSKGLAIAAQLTALAGSEPPAEAYHQHELADGQLRMMFACCHPALREEDRIALTLKIVLGFSMKEIAKALCTEDAVVQKRISRARAFLQEKELPLDIPSGLAVRKRLSSVHTVLYLLFNEGYNSQKADELIRYDLCAEAMRCCKALADHPIGDKPETHALLALMCLHAARFNSRLQSSDGLVLLSHQNREQWDRELIAVGYAYLNRSAKGSKLSVYHVEAAIAAEHAMCPRYEDTRWHRLLQLYDLLFTLKPSPVVLLNRAVVRAEMGQVKEAIEEVLGIAGIKQILRTNYLFSAVLGDFYLRLAQFPKAAEYLEQAHALTGSEAEKKFLQKKARLAGLSGLCATTSPPAST